MVDTMTVTSGQIGARIRQNVEGQIMAAKRAAISTAQEFLPIVVKATPSDRGQARAGWDIEVDLGGDDDTIAIISNDVPYIGVLELGSRPHTPPLKPLIEWVVRHFGTGLEALKAMDEARAAEGSTESDVQAAGKAAIDGASQHFDDLSEVSDGAINMAIGIQQKIGRQGTEPNYMVKSNIDRAERILDEFIYEELRDVE